ncbi:hypothetical protein Tco_1019270 [Tanacetum coccineum]|uniref:Uncharacterized protein n=1 Tax=Tanacetum coccineum TaxID=301880 RepID=A0ABQ5FWR8_9ASTR
MSDKYFVEYTGIEVKQFRQTLLQHMSNLKKFVAERTCHKRLYDRRVNKRQMQKQESKVDLGKELDVGLVVMESNGTESEVFKSSDSGKVLGKPVLQPLRNQSVVRQPNAFKSERPKISKPRFASQVDVEKDLLKPVTQHYLPNEKEYAFAKSNHMIASSSSRNSSKNMPRFSSNGMVHNHYLEEAKKKTQEKDRNSKFSVMHSASLQNTTNGSKPQPRIINQTSRSLLVSKSSCVTITVVPKADHSKNSSSFSDSKDFVCSTCHKCVFNANHDACITKFLKEVNSRAKVKYHKTRNCNKPIDQKSQIQKPNRQIFTGHRLSSNKSSDVYEKMSPRSCFRWKPTCIIFDTFGLRWITTGKLLDSCTGKVDSEPPHVQASLHNVNRSSYIIYDSYDVNDRVGNFIRSLFKEYFNGENLVVSKSFAVISADASDKRQQQPNSTSSTSTLATIVTADGNFDFDDGNPSRVNIQQLCGRTSKHGESNKSVLEDPTLSAGNPVKEIL